MGAYRLVSDTMAGEPGWVQRTADGLFVPPDPRNTDRQTFEAWLAEGNAPDPA
jgi:hypothetical protein